MKIRKLAIGLAAMLLAGGLVETASAHDGRPRTRVGVYVGAPVVWGSAYWGGPYWGPYPYPPMYYPPPQVVVVPPPRPPVYVEQNDPALETAPAQSQSYWYYCQSAKGYYPYVKDCAEGWQKVLPQPER